MKQTCIANIVVISYEHDRYVYIGIVSVKAN